ncbi:MAG: FMN-binding protein, partial [Elusimicrobiota bacterium]|nr:FMN-binding protein [Elusimicrobiota bacterium]
KQVEIMAFYEPEERLPSKKWFKQFAGKILNDELWPKKGIDAVTGATISVNSITQEVRKILAVFKIMINNYNKEQIK